MYVKVKDRKKCEEFNSLISDKIDDKYMLFELKDRMNHSFGFIQKLAKGYDIRCSFCNKTMTKLKAKSNEKCECANCGAALTLTRKHDINRETFLGYIEQINDDLYCARYFYYSQCAYKAINLTSEYCDEVKREFYSLKNGLEFSCHKGMGTNNGRLVFGKRYSDWTPDLIYPYTNSICADSIYCYFCPDLIPEFGGDYKYCSLKEVVNNGWGTNFKGHMELYKEHPEIEMCIKSKWKNGYYQFRKIIEKIDLNDKKILKKCIKNNYDKYNIFLAKYDVKEEDKELLNKCNRYVLEEALEKTGYEKTVKAIRKGYDLIMWKDYLEALESLGVSINKELMYPKDLREAHDRTFERKRIVEKQIFDEKIKSYSDELNINVADKKYKVIVPKTSKEIIQEGEMQHNCVGKSGYIEKMANRTSIICFLRKTDEPDKSFVTIELDPNRNTIRQAYAERNHECPKDALNFIKKNLLVTRKEGMANV